MTGIIRLRDPCLHLEAVELATLKWVDWFNHRRLLEPIGDMPPTEKEQMYDQNQEWAKVVWLTTKSLRESRGWFTQISVDQIVSAMLR